MDKEYTPGEAKAWLAGYDAGKAYAKKEWVGLSEEDLRTIYQFLSTTGASFNAIAIAVEAKVKEKNI
jgi:hypothetical protein